MHSAAARSIAPGACGPSSETASARAAPAIVEEVLRRPGQAIEAGTRSFMERRFGRDFSAVRVHTDARAAASARAVNAEAYTAGRSIVFGDRAYAPSTERGRFLIAHELTHVVQQNARAAAPMTLDSGSSADPHEAEAERVAGDVARAPGAAAGSPAAVQGSAPSSMVMRRLVVHDPTSAVPGPGGTGRRMTNAEAVEGYLRTMAPDGGITVNRTSGVCAAATQDFCTRRGRWGRFTRGVASGFRRGAEIGAYALLIGAIPGALIGGLIGGIAGLFGADSQAEESSTPTGSTCVCDFLTMPRTWTIELRGNEHPATLNTQRVWVPPPNPTRQFGAALASGRLETYQPWLILSHELCGHAWLEERQRASGSSGDEEGTVEGEDARHHRSVERENLIRAEHGLEARGYRLRDPYCGESFYIESSDPQRSVVWPETGAARQGGTNETYLQQCQLLREQYLGNLARRYNVRQRIPERP